MTKPQPGVRVLAFFGYNNPPVLAYVDEFGNWRMDVHNGGARPIYEEPRIWRYVADAADEVNKPSPPMFPPVILR